MGKFKADIDEVCELIVEGKQLREVAKQYGVALSTLHAFLTDKPEHNSKYKSALEISAQTFVAKAEQALNEITKNATIGEINRQKGLAALYMQMAKFRNPLVYSEKLAGTIDMTVTKKKTLRLLHKEDIKQEDNNEVN